LGVGDALATHPVGVSSLLQGGIIQLCAKGELGREQAFLLLGRVYPVLIGFLHRCSFFAGGEMRKRSYIPCLEQGTRLSSPWLKRGVFRRGKDKDAHRLCDGALGAQLLGGPLST